MRRSNLAQKQDLLKGEGTAAPARPFLVPVPQGQPTLTVRRNVMPPFVPSVPLSIEVRDHVHWWAARRKRQWRQMLAGLALTAALCAAWYWIVARML